MGKSAHGNVGKVGYYAHGNKERNLHCSQNKAFDCKGRRRYPAKILEPVVMERVERLIECESFSKELWAKSKASGSRVDENEKSQLERMFSKHEKEEDALASRLAELPKDVPADPLYRKMKETSTSKQKILKKLEKFQGQKKLFEDSSSFKTFRSFLQLVKECLKNADEGVKAKILSCLIERVEVGEDFVEIKFLTGSLTIEEQTRVCSSFLNRVQSEKLLPAFGSTSLTNGGGEWT